MKNVILASVLALGVTATAYAQDNAQVQQDKANIQKDKQEIKSANEAIKADKASGNTDQLKKDIQAKRMAKHAKHHDRKQLKKDEAAEGGQKQ